MYNLLGLFQIASQTFMFLLMYDAGLPHPLISRFFLFYLYFPIDESPEEWAISLRLLKTFISTIVLASLTSLFIINAYGVPSMACSVWAGALALLSLASSTTQFIPQIKKTWKLKVSTATCLSSPNLLLDGRSPQHPRYDASDARIISILLYNRNEPRYQYHHLDFIFRRRLSSGSAAHTMSLLSMYITQWLSYYREGGQGRRRSRSISWSTTIKSRWGVLRP